MGGHVRASPTGPPPGRCRSSATAQQRCRTHDCITAESCCPRASASPKFSSQLPFQLENLTQVTSTSQFIYFRVPLAITAPNRPYSCRTSKSRRGRAPGEILDAIAGIFVTRPSSAGRCCSTGRPTAGFVGRTRGVVVPRRARMSSGTTDRRRWVRLWLIRSSMPLRTARGGAVTVGAALPCALAPAPQPRFSRTTVMTFRVGQASRPGKRELLQW